MTDRQKEKEVNRQAVLFEEEVRNGTYLDGEKISFAEFYQQWLTTYAEKSLALTSLRPLKARMEQRILPAIGHIKLAKLQPHHLMTFYNKLREDGARLDSRYTPTDALIKLLEAYSIQDMIKHFGLSDKTCRRMKKGAATNRKTAEKVCAVLSADMKKMFASENKKSFVFFAFVFHFSCSIVPTHYKTKTF